MRQYNEQDGILIPASTSNVSQIDDEIIGFDECTVPSIDRKYGNYIILHRNSQGEPNLLLGPHCISSLIFRVHLRDFFVRHKRTPRIHDDLHT